MNLLNASQVAQGKQAMKNIFDTFARDLPVRFYRTAKQTVMVDPNYSSDWDQNINKNKKVSQYREFKCRVWYEEREVFENFMPGADKNVRYSAQYNRIKIQMELDAYEYLRGTERITFNGAEYNFDSSPRGLGILDTIDIYEIILQRVP